MEVSTSDSDIDVTIYWSWYWWSSYSVVFIIDIEFTGIGEVLSTLNIAVI